MHYPVDDDGCEPSESC